MIQAALMSASLRGACLSHRVRMHSKPRLLATSRLNEVKDAAHARVVVLRDLLVGLEVACARSNP
jgi:hypothetical protein